MHQFTTSERLVYSYLIGQVVINEVGFKPMDWTDSHSVLSMENIEGEPWRALGAVSDTKIGKHTMLTRMSAYNARMGLIDKGIIKDNHIYVPLEVILGGYVSIPSDIGLKGELLLFYAWYKEYCANHNNVDYTKESKIAEFYGASYYEIVRYIQRLVERGYIERKQVSQTIYANTFIK